MALPVRYTTPIFAIGTDRLNAASITPVLRRLSSPLFQSRLPRRMYDVTAVRHAQHPDGEPVNAGKPAAVAAKAAAIDAAVFGVIVLRTDWPLATLGRAAQGLWTGSPAGTARRYRPGPPAAGRTRHDPVVLGKNWRQAAVLTACRLASTTAACWPPCGHRSQPAALPGAAGLCRRRDCRAVPAHPGRAGHRGGQPERPADPGRRPRPTPSWPSWPTGSPPTGSPCWPGRRPTCCSATATGGRPPAAPRRARPLHRIARALCHESLRRLPRRRTRGVTAVTAVTGRWPTAGTAADAPARPSDA